MMEMKCVDVEHIGNVLEYPEDHPVRRHVADCPRCRTLAENFRAFMRAETTADAGLDRARVELDGAIARLAGRALPAASPAERGVKRMSWVRGLLRPMPALAAVAVVVAVAAVVLTRDRGFETPVLRTQDGAGTAWLLHEPALRRDGAIVLSWEAVAGADAYQVGVFGVVLESLATLGPVLETSVVLDRSALPADLPDNADLTWRVIALRAGAQVAVSEPRSVRMP
ncbi:MAG: hypothetical protein OEX18_12960 [Candidatus Krumholzibacteria bacterium]|nr:hypothetical protein [Candidatus Krumholzibacteria bacterium]MDH4338175.1 hypothetical protein [Candidatus Krumholzibacteria bacterium]MDH5269836.1 hypothetical protein [Candidatus Krumholzibacteria bacterium]